MGQFRHLVASLQGKREKNVHDASLRKLIFLKISIVSLKRFVLGRPAAPRRHYFAISFLVLGCEESYFAVKKGISQFPPSLEGTLSVITLMLCQVSYKVLDCGCKVEIRIVRLIISFSLDCLFFFKKKR